MKGRAGLVHVVSVGKAVPGPGLTHAGNPRVVYPVTYSCGHDGFSAKKPKLGKHVRCSACDADYHLMMANSDGRVTPRR